MSLSTLILKCSAASVAVVKLGQDADETAAKLQAVVSRITTSSRAIDAQEQKIAAFLSSDIMGDMLNQYLLLAELAKTEKNLDLTRFGVIEDIIKRFSKDGRSIDFSYLRRRGTSGVSSPTSTQQSVSLSTASSQGKLPSSGGIRF